MDVDFHAHSSYSDGDALPSMVSAANACGLDAVGFTDHCNLTEKYIDEKLLWNRNFDLTYERRRTAIEILENRHDITVYDAVEVDYEPGIESRIEQFLASASFDYVLGSVHYVDGREVFPRESFEDDSRAVRETFVNSYYDAMVSLIDCELFDIAAHVDIIENHPSLRGLTTEDHRLRVANAFTQSRTIPEINVSHSESDGNEGPVHPSREFIDVLLEHDVSFTVGTDSHNPGEFEQRLPQLDAIIQKYDIEFVAPPDLR